MAKARFDIPTQIPAGATRPLYAGVGMTDLVVGAVRDYMTDVQKTVTGLDYQPQALREQATKVPTRLQKLVDEQVATAGDTYAELVKRGETLVGRIRGQQSTQDAKSSAATTKAKAKTTRTQAVTPAKKTVKKTAAKAKKSPARSSAKATGTAAKKTAKATATATKDAASKVGS